MKTPSEMTAEERQYFLQNAAQVAYSEIDDEIESRLAQFEPRRFNEGGIVYDDCEDESDEITEEDTNRGCKALLELIE